MDEHVAHIVSDHGLDPILAVIAESAVAGPDRKVAFDPAGLKRIEEALKARRSRNDLPEALTAMVAFSAYLDRDCRSPKAAADVMNVALTALDALNARVKMLRAEAGLDDEARRKTEQLANFLGDVQQRSAPMIDGKKAAGTVSVNELFKPTKFSGR